LRLHWARPCGNKVYHQINLAAPGGWPDQDYRVPDLVLLTPDRFHIDHNEYFEGAPRAVVEIHSPGDEAYEKLSFYADLHVPEVWINDRDTKQVELFVVENDVYRQQAADTDGWMLSKATGIVLKSTGRETLLLQIQDAPGTRAETPEV